MHQLMLRFKTVQIGMRQWRPASIFMDKHERRATDETSWNTQPFRNTTDQRGLARAQLSEERHDLSTAQALSDQTPQLARVAR
jgi:hypothetical protein